MSRPRTLVFTAAAPPSSAAAAQVLARLLAGAEEHFGFICPDDHVRRGLHGSEFFPVDHPFPQVARCPILWRLEKIGWYRAAVREGNRQAASGKWDVMLGCYPNLAFTLAAAKVARTHGLPLVLYLMDLLTESRVSLLEKTWARTSERRVLTRSSAVFCLTDGMREHYARRYDINPYLLAHCVTVVEISEAMTKRRPLDVGSPVRIVFAGGVYQARFDSLLAVNEAIEKLNAEGFRAELFVLGRNDPIRLASWGLGGPHVNVRCIEGRSEFMEELRRSDILLSTIAFKSAYPLQDQTCFPTKTFDYFLAGKPILVVAPGNSHYVAEMRKHDCALVVESLDAGDIATGIRRLATDMSLRERLVEAGDLRLRARNQKNIQPLLREVLTNAAEGTPLWAPWQTGQGAL